MAEAGFKGQEADTLQGLLLPAGTPKNVVIKVAGDVRKMMALPDMKEKVNALGFDVVASTPEEFSAQVRAEVDKWGKVVKAAGIKAE